MASLRHRVIAVAILSCVSLSGCVRVLAETTVHESDTFSQHVIAAADPAALDQVGQQSGDALPAGFDLSGADEALAEVLADNADSVDVAEYIDGDLEGVEIHVSDLPIERYDAVGADALGTLGVGSTLTREGDEYVVTIDTSGLPALDEAGLSASDLNLADSAIEFDIVYRFPGLVTDASAGTVDGKQVTLGIADLAAGEEITMTAGAHNEIYWAPIIQWGLIALAFAVIVGGAWLLVLQDRRKRRPTHLPPPKPSTA